MNARVAKINSFKIYPNKDTKSTDEELCAQLTEDVTVIIKIGDEEHTLTNCQVDVYTPVIKLYDEAEHKFYDADRITLKE